VSGVDCVVPEASRSAQSFVLALERVEETQRRRSRCHAGGGIVGARPNTRSCQATRASSQQDFRQTDVGEKLLTACAVAMITEPPLTDWPAAQQSRALGQDTAKRCPVPAGGDTEVQVPPLSVEESRDPGPAVVPPTAQQTVALRPPSNWKPVEHDMAPSGPMRFETSSVFQAWPPLVVARMAP
jgi:hypothetical protein